MAHNDRVHGLDEWQRLIASSIVPMRVRALSSVNAEDFSGCLKRTALGPISVSLVEADGHIAQRTDADIRLHPADFFKISLQLDGETHLVQDGREVTIRCGDAAIYDAMRPYDLRFDRYSRSIVVQIPYTDFPLSATLVSNVTAVGHTTPQPVRDLLEIALDDAEPYPATMGANYHRGVALGYLLGAEVETLIPAVATVARESRLWADIDRYITAHLSNPDLTTDDVARANFLSRRTVQRLFEHAGTTFSAWLKERRLERAHERLLSTTDPIAVIARECGFSSPQYFSRAFHGRYHITARNLRRNEEEF
ncbi:AraC family transcriptional regulator [Citricoccus sp. GCM10030269]|uniref:helix-turn-helix transcriptional regulator n=1 Tax=Citricoccus sp. GCM10030269 TaxID=3273388 RepID=UPI00361D222A